MVTVETMTRGSRQPAQMAGKDLGTALEDGPKNIHLFEVRIKHFRSKHNF